MQTLKIVLLLTLFQLSHGLYIKPVAESVVQKVQINNVKDKWSDLQHRLGLTNHKVELLKSQKDQRATMDLINRFIKENPKYVTVPSEAAEKSEPKTFLDVYHSLLKQLSSLKSPLKTSLNVELADNPTKTVKRSRRKIALKMVSDLSSEKIDELLQVFNQQHGITDDSDPEVDDQDEADGDYNQLGLPLPSAADPDYSNLYDNLYEDEEDLEAPAKSHSNSEFGSFQDLILQAKRNQWEREVEETRLRGYNNDHFV